MRKNHQTKSPRSSIDTNWFRRHFNAGFIRGSLLGSLIVSSIGCGKSTDSFSLSPEAENYKQVADITQRKVDILWVIDNSGSMNTSQTALATYFSSFVQRFQNYDYDFHIGVTTTDAYKFYFTGAPAWARLRDGTASTHSGVFVIDPLTPDLIPTFQTNIKQGIKGSGDERAFQSIEAALNTDDNINGDLNFRREDAYLAIIIVSDEDDFSQTDPPGTTTSTQDYDDPRLFKVEHYVNFLDKLTNSLPYLRSYSVSAITVLDDACLNKLKAGGRKIAERYIGLVDQTGGTKASICADFSESLSFLSDKILELTSVFKLNREPLVESIRVFVDGILVEKDEKNGWSYDPLGNQVIFHGNAIPANGAGVRVAYDPVTVVL